MTLIAYADASVLPRTVSGGGIGGLGVALYEDGKLIEQFSHPYSWVNIDEAEIMAVLKATDMAVARVGDDPYTIFTDSLRTVNHVHNGSTSCNERINKVAELVRNRIGNGKVKWVPNLLNKADPFAKMASFGTLERAIRTGLIWINGAPEVFDRSLLKDHSGDVDENLRRCARYTSHALNSAANHSDGIT